MAEDIEKPRGSLKRSSPGAGGANPRMAATLGIVKDNVDPTRSGVIKVFLTDNPGLDPDNKDNWRPVRLLTPFYGLTRPDAPNTGEGTFKGNPSSYGMWMSPPDIGTTVLCLFADGDMNYGFYIGSVMEPEAMTMIPAIGATDNIVPNQGEADSYGGALRLPVTNINTNNKKVADGPGYIEAPKPIHSYSSAIMFQQGILRDPIRGPISSSSQRETPSRVGWGVSTPGRPIYQGGFDDASIAENLKGEKAKQLRVVSRRGGHTIVMDDGDLIGRDNLVRIRTSLGHQILMSDDGQCLMILHSNGQSYIELGKEGTVDIYSTNSINLRTQGDLNLHADNNVNIHATKNLNLQGENIQFNSEQEFKGRVGTDYSVFTLGKHLTKVSGAMSMESGGDISMASTSIAYVNGKKVNLNSGATGTKPVEVTAIDKVLHTDTLFDTQKGFLAAPAKLVSITTRAPAHAPWSNAGQGVDVKTDLNASTQLPQSPPANVLKTNNAAGAALQNPVTAATAASAPATNNVSSAMKGEVASAIAGAQAQSVTTGPLADAAKIGVAVGQTPQGVQAAVGKLALTSTQLEQAGTIKPGAAALVNSLASKTGNVVTSMTQNLFTGQPGAENLQTLAGSVASQTNTFTKNLQQAQTALQSTGVITGNETPSQLGGLALATVNSGISKTVDAVKAIGSGAGAGNLGSQVDGVLKDIGKGNFAAAVGEGLNGALAGIGDSVEALTKSPSLAGVIDQTKGIAASAFSAIKESLKPMKAGVPQNLTELAKKAAEETASASLTGATDALSEAAQSLKSQVGGAIAGAGAAIAGAAASATATGDSIASAASGGLTNATSLGASLIKTAQGAASSAVASAANQLSSIATTGAASATAFASPKSLTASGGTALADTARTVSAGLVTSATSAVASGLGALPGGQSAVSAVSNLAKSAVPGLPGTDTLKDAIKGAAATAMTGVNQLSADAKALIDKAKTDLGGLKSAVTTGLPAGAAAQLQSALSSVAAAGSGIKIPAVGLNTTDRTSLTNAAKGQLGDPGIPTPNFGEISEAAKGKVAEIAQDRLKFTDARETLNQDLTKAEDALAKAFDEYNQALFSLPPGDPTIATLQAKFNDSVKKQNEIKNKLAVLIKDFPNLAAANPPIAPPEPGTPA